VQLDIAAKDALAQALFRRLPESVAFLRRIKVAKADTQLLNAVY
jgi:hypothetical protein